MRVTLPLVFSVTAAALLPTLFLGALISGGRLTLPTAIIAAIGFALSFGLFVSLLVARWALSPIREFLRTALEIGSGKFGREVTVRGRSAISDLAYAFNHMSRELASYDAENRELILKLERGYLDTIRALAGAIDAKDPYTRGHSDRVSHLAVEIGLEMKLSPDLLRALEMGGILHDVGKIGVPDLVLGKPGKLDPHETELMQAHPGVGADIIGGVDFLKHAISCVRHHHERWDGRGYPDGLSEANIPLVARIVNAADTWDACTTERPYQAALAPQAALETMSRLRGTQIDPTVYDALVAVIRGRGLLPASATAA